MALKKFNPTTPGQRQLVMVDRSALYKGKPIKALTEGKHSNGGRGNTGRITVRFRGGGHKKSYRIVDFKRTKVDVPAKVERLEYDPNRTAFIALIKYQDGEQAYILAPQRLAVGDTVVAGSYVDVKPGNVMPLGNMPIGTIVHNVEMKIGKGGQIARSAGTYAQLVGRDHDYVIMRLNSGEQRLVHGRCTATIGAVSNPDHMNISIGKAGRTRWLGWRPHNRGVVMNPVDHPHGGGEGRTSGGRHPVTPWGKPTKGKKTRSNKSTNKFILISRHKRKKYKESRTWFVQSGKARSLKARCSRKQMPRARPAVMTSSRSGAVARPSCRSSSVWCSASTMARSTCRCRSTRRWSVTSSVSFRRPEPSMVTRVTRKPRRLEV